MAGKQINFDRWEKENPLAMRQGSWGSVQQDHGAASNHSFHTVVIGRMSGKVGCTATRVVEVDEQSELGGAGLGTMGFGFPAANRSKNCKSKETKSLCITGDGGFQMNIGDGSGGNTGYRNYDTVC